MNYYINITSNKAKNDVNLIVEKLGYRNLTPNSNRSDMFTRFWIKICGVIKILSSLHKGDILFLQYPMKKFFRIACVFAHIKGAKVVTLVHDLGAFRRHKLTPQKENRLLEHSDFTIIHNESMEQWLLKHGYRNPLCCLGIFDYISPSIPAKYNSPHTPWKVVYAGGLGPWRSGFLYNLDKYIHNWQMELYGKGLDKEEAKNWKHIIYHGSLTPDELLATVEGDFGLVWDGDTIDTCSGNWGEYLRVNNPHKTSFSLRCGLPVIIWTQAALAPFIKNHEIGICVNSLADIDNALQNVTDEQYAKMKKNAQTIGYKLSKGYYTSKALLKAESLLTSTQ